MSRDSIYQQLRSHLAYLKPAAAAEALPGHLEAARQSRLGHTQFLEGLLRVEVEATEARRWNSRMRFANFPTPWQLDDYASSPPSPASTRNSSGNSPQALIRPTRPTCCSSDRPESAKPCSRPSRAEQRSTAGIVSTTPPQPTSQPDAPTAALEGRWAPTMRFFSGPAVLIIDELGYLPMPSEDAASLFQVISRRYQKGSVILTTNRNVASWGDIFSDTTIAAAMLDRLLHRSVVFTITGDSYRLRAYQAQARKHRPKGAAS